MANGHSKGPWKAEWSKSRGIPVLFIRNGRRDPIAMVYSSEADADLMAAAPLMLAELKRAEASLRMREDSLRASEKASLARIRALIAELSA